MLALSGFSSLLVGRWEVRAILAAWLALVIAVLLMVVVMLVLRERVKRAEKFFCSSCSAVGMLSPHVPYAFLCFPMLCSIQFSEKTVVHLRGRESNFSDAVSF